MSNELSLPLDTEKLYDRIDEVVQQAIDKGDPEVAFNLGKDFLKIERVSGLALGRLAFMMRGRWPEFDNPVRFEDVAAIYWDVDKIHLERLIRTTEMLQSGDIPEPLQQEIEQKGVKDLIVMSSLWQEMDGHLEEADWERLSDTDNDYEIRDIAREMRNLPPRKHTIFIWMTRDGDLYCKVGSGENKHFGYLNLELKNDPEVAKAIDRIVNNARISIP